MNTKNLLTQWCERHYRVVYPLKQKGEQIPFLNAFLMIIYFIFRNIWVFFYKKLLYNNDCMIVSTICYLLKPTNSWAR